MARMFGSASSSANNSGSSDQNAGPIALPLPGPINVTCATLSLVSTRTDSYGWPMGRLYRGTGLGLDALKVEVEVPAVVDDAFAVHDADHRGVVDALEVIVNRLAVVDHGRGDFAAKFLQPQAGFALAHLDVGEPVPFVVETDQRLHVVGRVECLAEPAGLLELTVHPVAGDEFAALPIAEHAVDRGRRQAGPEVVEFGVVDRPSALLEFGELLERQRISHRDLLFGSNCRVPPRAAALPESSPGQMQPCANCSMASFSSGAPMVTRTPSAPYGRTTMRASAARSTKSRVRGPSGSQTKFACDDGSANPAACRASLTRARSATTASVRASSSSAASSEAMAAACEMLVAVNGT